jgi:hypothetical protein
VLGHAFAIYVKLPVSLYFFDRISADLADRDRMRRAFLRTFGQPPQVIRQNARTNAMA